MPDRGLLAHHCHSGSSGRGLAVVVALIMVAPALATLPGGVAGQEPSDVPENLLFNGDFERESSSAGNVDSRPLWWDPYPLIPPGDATLAVDATVSHNGSRSAYLARTSADAGDEVMWYTDVYPTRGQHLPFGGWVRTDLEPDASVVLRVRVYRGRFPVHTATAEWPTDSEYFRELSGTDFDVEWDNARVRFECILKGNGKAWFDDVYLGRPSDMDNAPIVVSVPPLEAAVGHNYTYQARALDLEGDEVVFDLVLGPDNMTVTEEGLVDWTPSAVPTEAVRVVLEANDTHGHAGYQDFFIRVLEEPMERPVHILLYGTMDDHTNVDLSAQRLLRTFEILSSYMLMSNPILLPKYTLLLNGADARALSEATEGPGAALYENLTEGPPEVQYCYFGGYTPFHEPTYETSPLYALGGDASWSEVVRGTIDLLSLARDPYTGEPIGGEDAGGLLAADGLRSVTMVTGLGSDPAQLHALSKYDEASVLLSLDDGPLRVTTPVEREELETLHSMMAEDPNAPYALYWEGGRLRIGTADDGMDAPVLRASDGADAINRSISALDRSRVHVIPVQVGEKDIYCNGSTIVDGWHVGSPTDWAYAHPGSPELPEEAIRPQWEQEALYNATNESLAWLLWEHMYPGNGIFLNTEWLDYLVDPGTCLTVSASELASAARDLIVRRVDLEYPDWVGASWGFCQGDYQYFSLSEMYGLLVSSLAMYEQEGRLPAAVGVRPLNGPLEGHAPSGPHRSMEVRDIIAEASRLNRSLWDETWRLEPRGIVPSRSSPGGMEVNAMEFLLLLAEAYLVLFDQGPDDVLVRVYPTLQWPLTKEALERPGPLRFASASWAVKPTSARSRLDDTRPYVRHVTPSPGARNVPLDTSVTVIFSERMDESRPLDDVFEITPGVPGRLHWEYHRLVFEPAADLTENMTYTVSIKVRPDLRDLAGNILGTPFSWNFTTATGRNLDPVLHPIPIEANVTILENQTLRLAVVVEDDGPEPLTYEWLLDGVVRPEDIFDSFIYLPGFNDAGNHTVTVVVRDAADPPGTATFTWNVSVYDVNLRPRVLGWEPEEGQVVVNERLEGVVAFKVFAEDPDEGQPWFKWTVDGEAAPGGWVSANGSVLTFLYDFDSAGNYTIECVVGDPATQVQVGWALEIVDVNRPPEISGIDPEWSTVVELGEPAQIKVEATDPDGDRLTFLWLVDEEERASTGDGTWNFTSQSEGSFTVKVVVGDGRGGSTEGFVIVNVLPEDDDGPGPKVRGFWPWLLVLAVIVAIAVVIAWPRLRRRNAP